MPDDLAAPAPGNPEPDPRAFEAERMDALAFLAGGLSHDLANPLGAILAFSSYLASDPRLPVDLRDDARLLRGEAERIHRLVRTLLELARNRPAVVTEVSVPAVLGEVLELEAYVLSDIPVERAFAADLPPVRSDPSRLRHLLLVLSVEAVRRLGDRPRGSTLEIAARQVGDRVAITIGYRGGGPRAMAAGPEAAAAALARELGGALRHTGTGDGGTFELELPAAYEPAASAERRPRDAALSAMPSPAAAAPGSRIGPGTSDEAHEAPEPAAEPTVLVCDDEASIRALLSRVLARAGFAILEAASADEALALIERARVDVVLTDHRMHGASGIELYEQATAGRPALRRRFLLLTGDPHADDVVQFARGTGVTVVSKPFETGAIVARVRELLAPEGP